MAYQKNSPLDWQTPIVDPNTGLPSPQFIRLWQSMFKNDEQVVVDIEQVITDLAQKADKSTQIIAGTGLSGGGDLSADRTINLDAGLDDLNDVDLTTTPPADGEVLTFDALSSLWVPGVGGGGGGGGGGAKWEILRTWSFATDGAVANIDVNTSDIADLMIVGVGVTRSISGLDAVRFSVDGGATFYSGATDYYYDVGTGVLNNLAYMQFVNTTTGTSTAARYWQGFFSGLNVAGAPKTSVGYVLSSGFARYGFTASLLPVNAIRLYNTGAGNFNGGAIYVLGRRATPEVKETGIYELIEEVPLSAGAFTVTGKDFSAYSQLRFTLDDVQVTSANTYLNVRLETGGVLRAAAYRYDARGYSSSNATNSSSSTSTSQLSLNVRTSPWGVGSSSWAGISGEWYITNIANSPVYKSFRGTATCIGDSGNAHYAFVSGILERTEPVTGFVVSGTSNITAGTMRVYGIRKAPKTIKEWTTVANWDFSVNGAVAAVSSTDLTPFSEVLVQGRGVGASVSGQRIIQVSVDGGATWYTTSGDYNELAATGVATNNQAMFPHTTATGSARDFAVNFFNIRSTFKVAHLMPRMVQAQFVASTLPITNVRVLNSTGGNLNAGQVQIYAR